MSDTLYLQIDKNVKVVSEDVYLQDIARLSCSNPKVLSRSQVLKVLTIPPKQYGRYVVAVMDIIEDIQKREEHVDVSQIGEANFIITFEKPPNPVRIWNYLKTVFVCSITFFGTAFSIMTFNTDVSVKKLFNQIYQQFMGRANPGFSILEISYSVGIAIGCIFFFNHFGKRKITQDPTPMEVEMRTYEDQVDTTIVEQISRKEKV